MNQLFEVLERYGVNIQLTMERFVDDEDLYLTCLGMLIPDKNWEKLANALKVSDYNTAFEAAHTLKGIVGNLGLEPLYKRVCEIVAPLRANDSNADYDLIYTKIQQELDVLKGIIPLNKM